MITGISNVAPEGFTEPIRLVAENGSAPVRYASTFSISLIAAAFNVHCSLR